MMVALSAPRLLTIILSTCLALGASPLGGDALATAERNVDSLLPSSSYGYDASGSSPQEEGPDRPEISRKAVERFRDKVLDMRREGRLRRGLTAEETLDEKYERLSRMHRRRDEGNLKARREWREREYQRLMLEGDDVNGERKHDREDDADASSPRGRPSSFESDDPMRRRRRAQLEAETGEIADGIFFSAVSPGVLSTDPDSPDDDLFYCPGTYNLVNGEPEKKQPLGLRDCLALIAEAILAGGDISDAIEIYWEFRILDDFRQTARLPGLSNFNWDWYMETRKYKKGKYVLINHHNPQNPLQVWDFRPGPGTIDDPGRLVPAEDRTWRPEAQLGKQNLCVEPVFSANGTLQEFNPMQLARCSNKNKKRERQVWIYCFESLSCGTDGVEPPDFEIRVTCEESPTDELSCTETVNRRIERTDQDLNDGMAVEEVLWDDLGECDSDPDKDNKFGKSLVYQLPGNEKRNDEGLNIQLTYSDDDGNCLDVDANAILRVYREDDDGDWECAVIAQTDCGTTDGELIEVDVEQNEFRDFLIVVSSDGTDSDGSGNILLDFDMTVQCEIDVDDSGEDLTSGDENNNLYCFGNTRLNVDDDERNLPSDFDDRSACVDEPEDIDPDQLELQNTWQIVDTRGIEGTITVESLCNNDGEDDDLGLQTLIRIYQIDGPTSDKYECVASDILDCGIEDSPSIELELKDDEGDPNDPNDDEILVGFQYLIVATGATNSENCQASDFDCR